MTTQRTHTKGFSLVESLVAITMLILAVSGAFAAAQNGISTSIYAKDQVIAFYLAGEGVEMIRNVRDQNGLVGQNWLTGIAANASDPCYFGKKCKVDAVTNQITSCASECEVLRLNTTSGFYGYTSSWSPTNFKREITLTQVNANEVSITVSVQWSKGLVQRNFKAREIIFNWQ